MNFACVYVKINMVVGKHTRKSFGDATHFKTLDSSLARGKFVGFGHHAILKILRLRKSLRSASEVSQPTTICYGRLILTLPSVIPFIVESAADLASAGRV